MMLQSASHEHAILWQILKTLPYSVFWKDRNSTYLGCNQLFAEATGLEKANDIIGLTDYDLPWSKEESDAYRADDAEVIAKDISKLHIVETQRTADGRDTWLDTSKVPLKDEHGEIFGVLGVFYDITKQVCDQQDLKNTRDYLCHAMEAISSGIVLYNKENELILCNQGYKDLYSEAAHVMQPGTNYADVLRYYINERPSLLDPGKTSEDWVKERLERHGREERDWLQEFPEKTIKVSDRRTEDGSIVSLRTDITAEREAAEKLERALQRAEEASKTKSRFLANMSHEIRTPLAGIMGMASLLLDTKLDSSQDEYVEAISQSSKALMRILNDILDISKIEAERIVLCNASFSLKETVASVLRTYTAIARQREIGFVVMLDAPLEDIHLYGDGDRISQILNNIIGNAVKFTPDNGWVVVNASALRVTEDEVRMKLSISDTGIGISAEVQEHIFSAFRQADETTTRQYGGTGLGLTISQELAGLMGSEIKVDSVEGCGSVFSLELTLPIVVQPKSKETVEDAELDLSAIHGKKVLIVEDNPVNLKVLSSLLRKFEVEVFPATDGRQALKVCDTEEIDLILTDIQMPVMDGMELAQHLRSVGNSAVRIVAVTAHAMIGDKERFLNAGMDDYISKPIHQNELEHILSKHLSDAPSEPH